MHTRDPESDTGYQRLFVDSHISQIKKYLDAGKCIPTALLVTFKGAKFEKGKLRILKDPKKGWIIDGQHRWLAAKQLTKEIPLPMAAFIDLPLAEQIEHFVVISPPIFFQTIGFGAFMNFFPAFFGHIYATKKAFTRELVRQSLVELGEINFDLWRNMGTGTQAENSAAEQLETLFDGDSADGKEPPIAL